MLFNKFSGSKAAMTLAELLITIGVIGVIAAITLPVLRRCIPSRNETKMKKMTYVIEQVVTQLFNDDVMYPKRANSFDEGFQNTEKVTINGKEYGGGADATGIGTESLKAKQKFCLLFASKFNITGDLKCEYGNRVPMASRDDAYPNAYGGQASGTNGIVPTFTTIDGVEWYLLTLPQNAPSTKPFDIGYEKLVIDVNGPEVPNCIEGGKGKDVAGREITCTAKQADRFVYYIKMNGTVTKEKPNDLTKNSKLVLTIVPEGDCTGCGWKVKPITDKVQDGRTVEDLSALGNKGENCGRSTKVTVLPKHKYIIEACPTDEYISPWQMDRRKVIINNTNATVTVAFQKRDTRCIAVKVNGCGSDDVRNCIKFTLKGGCKYCCNPSDSSCPEKSKCSGSSLKYEYDYDSDGAYNFVGQNDGSWAYECSGTDKSGTAQKGIPEYNKDETLKYDSSNNVKLTQTGGAVYVCGLIADNYQLEAKGKEGTGYTISNGTTKKCDNGTMISENKYSQAIKLGPSNLQFSISVKTGATTSCP